MAVISAVFFGYFDMRRSVIFAAALAAFGVAGFADATTVGVGFDNVGINAGAGAHMTLPGGYLQARQSFGHLVLSGKFVGAGGENHSDYFGGNANVGYRLSLDGLGHVTPGVEMGYHALNTPGTRYSAAFAGFHLRYSYGVTRDVRLVVNGGFGRDFATSVSFPTTSASTIPTSGGTSTPLEGLSPVGEMGGTSGQSASGIPTIGGLEYSAGIAAQFKVGPGLLNAGYEYRHLPLSTANDLHINTGQFTVGYAMRF